MRTFVDQNYRRCQKRERRMKRFANQKVRRWQNHCPKTRNGSRPTYYLHRQGHGQFITFKVKTEKVIPKRNTCRPQKFHGNKSKLAPEKIASARTQMLLRLRRSTGLC